MTSGTTDHNQEPDRRKDQQHARPGSAADSAKLIDALLDDDLSEERSRQVLRRLRDDPAACEDLARTRIGIERLREPIETPDLTDAILARVHVRRRFLPQRARRMVTAGRVALAAGLVGAVGIASLVQRHVPAVRLADDPAVVTRLVEAAAPEIMDRPALAAQTVETIQSSLGSGLGSRSSAHSVSRLTLSPRVRIGESLHYDLSIDHTPGAVWASAGHDAPTPVRTQLITLGVPTFAVPPAAQEETPTTSPLLSRFRPLLMYLRNPPGRIETDVAESDE
ncbi:MAG: hypothetical protein Q9O74_01085 [Planctomycetota bacterium]|nr:hypothetical protein [Planctomycetota bacterium]